jgi:serine/threonine protein kinase
MPDGHPLRPDDPAELGGHRLTGRLGEGTQGVVYLARSPSGEHVAIKLLHARMAEDPGARERFVRELSAAKKVARFCTAQVLDADLAGDQPYIVSEYVEGRSLRSHIADEGPRTGGALERLAIGTLTALAAIHKAGIVHRDFTPHNVLLGPDGPRVIDFGIARALGAARNAATNSVGTPSYMAPEQVAGREIGPPADMFAWGSTILFAATGRPPFGNESVHAVMERILRDEPDLSALPEPLRSVVSACLSKDPAQRPTAQLAQASLLGYEAPEALVPPPAFGTTPVPALPRSGDASAALPTILTPAPGAIPVASPAEGTVAETPAPERPISPARRSAPLPARSSLTPASTSAVPRRRPRVGWAILAGAAVVVAGAAVAVPLWPRGGDAATAPKARAAAVPTTPTPAPVTHGPHINGVRSAATRTVEPQQHKKKRPATGCRDYQRSYTVSHAGSVFLKVSVCRGAYAGDAVLADTAAKDGWDICLQLRGHITGSGEVYVSTTLSSRDGGLRAFDNGPRLRYGAKTTRTQDFLVVNVGRCTGSGATISTSWQTQSRLAAG